MAFKNEAISMSSKWNDDRMEPWNVLKENFNPNWGKGDFSCIHTLNDKEGPWWSAKFGMEATVTKVQILNREDCCGKRLTGTKVSIGDSLCGTISDAPKGEWLTLNCHARGNEIKIQAA